MTYNELKNITNVKNLQLKQVAEGIGMSRQGLQTSIENQTLPISKVLDLCKMLGITPNDFFGVNNETVSQSVNSNSGTVTVTGIDRRQYYSDSPDVLKAQVELLEERIKEKDSQIKEKDSQIKEKDSQINSLLSILKGK